VVGQYFDVSACTGLGGDGDGKGGPAKGTTWFMIFKATETELFWGDDTGVSGKTADGRPTKLETRAYKKL